MKNRQKAEKNNEYFIDDTCFDVNVVNDYKNKTIDEINDEIVMELLHSGLYDGKTYEEVLEYVKNDKALK